MMLALDIYYPKTRILCNKFNKIFWRKALLPPTSINHSPIFFVLHFIWQNFQSPFLMNSGECSTPLQPPSYFKKGATNYVCSFSLDNS